MKRKNSLPLPVRYPVILRIMEKHDDAYYICQNSGDVARAALAIVSRRYEDGWYDEEANVKRIVDNNDGVEAFRLMVKRREYEYEAFGFEYSEPTTCLSTTLFDDVLNIF